MRLAHELHKTEDEILEMSPDQFARWLAYFKILERKRKQAPRSRG